MPKVNYLVEDLIDEYKVFADDFFIDDTTKIFDDDDDPVEEFEYVRGRDVEPGGSYNIDG